MGQTARGIEESGIATVTVYADIYRRWALDRIKFPRLVLSPFFIGRLLGEPGHPERHRAVIAAALGLLENASQPGAFVELPYRWMRLDDEDAKR